MDSAAPELQNQMTDEDILDGAKWLQKWTTDDGHPALRKPWETTPVCRLMLIAADLLRMRYAYDQRRWKP